MAIEYTRGNISKAVYHLATADEPMPLRAWDAYMISTRDPTRDGLEYEYSILESIFRGIRGDEVDGRLSLEDAKRGAALLLEMHDALVARTATAV